MGIVEDRLQMIGYRKRRGNLWVKNGSRVNVVHSKERLRGYYRITFREKWNEDHAVIYDYSSTGGPVCVVPINVLYHCDFVSEKRLSDGYENSGYWWTQRFPVDHELTQLILNYGDNWKILE